MYVYTYIHPQKYLHSSHMSRPKRMEKGPTLETGKTACRERRWHRSITGGHHGTDHMNSMTWWGTAARKILLKDWSFGSMSQTSMDVGTVLFFPVVFPQQRKLMGSSAQNSSGVHWCRRRVRLNRVAEKVPDKVWEALVQSQVRFNRFRRRFQRRFRRRPGRLWCRARSGSRWFRRRFREGVGGFGEEPGQDQQGSGEGSGEVSSPAARFRKICKNKTLQLKGIPPKLIFFNSEYRSIGSIVCRV